MEFVAAKCPNCGGELRLPDDMKTAKCMYCGFDVIVRDAINAAGANVGNWLKLASSAEETGNYAEAYKYFTQVLEYEPDNYIAQLGKGITAGYLSTPYKFRSDEMLKGVKAAIENAPDEKKQEIRLQTAEKIREVCSDFKVGESDESKLQQISVIECLDLAHSYAPENENILRSLYSSNHIMSLEFRLLNSRYQTDTWNESINERTQKAHECLSKLQVINPEEAADIVKSEKETEQMIKNSQATASGTGCLIMIIFIIIPVILLAVSL